jgi:transketolase N-terminal domain/subunit
MTADQREELEQAALRVRQHIIGMSTNGGCFIGASLSCADLLVYLYWRFLNISPMTVNAEDRDVLLLSKGHDVPALYGVLAERGFISKDRLKNHLSVDDHIYWHPNRAVSGVEELRLVLHRFLQHGVRFTINTDATYTLGTDLRREVELLVACGILDGAQVALPE